MGKHLKKMRNKKNKFALYNKVAHALIRVGKKRNAISPLLFSLFILQKQYDFNFLKLLIKLFKKLYTRLEVRSVLLRGRLQQVPFKIKKHRRLYIVTKWILNSMAQVNKKLSLQNKIAKEIMLLFKNSEESHILKQKKSSTQLLALNKANLHFRW